MTILLALPVLGAATMLQSAIFSRITLLSGPADVVLLTLVSWSLHDQVKTAPQWALIAGLFVGWISAVPAWQPPASYLLVTGLMLLLRRIVWQIPVLALFSGAILGTLITQFTSYMALQLIEVPLEWGDAFNLIVLPSLLLNLLLAIPVNGVIHELVRLSHPTEVET